MARVILSNPAIFDIEEILHYNERDNVRIAQIFSKNLFKKFQLLENFPRLGKVTSLSPNQEIRIFLHQNYRIIYRIEENIVEILRIIHSSRLFDFRDL